MVSQGAYLQDSSMFGRAYGDEAVPDLCALREKISSMLRPYIQMFAP
jgi:hypothetical protein